MTFSVNIWGLVAIVIVSLCLFGLINNIINSIVAVKSMKALKDYPEEQRDKIINQAIKKSKTK